MGIPTFVIHTINVRLAFLYSMHPEIFPLVPPTPIPVHPCFEVPHILFWGPGSSVTSSKVLSNNYTPAQLGHDCGIGIIHIGMPAGPLSLVNTAVSSCKVVFAVGSVLSENKPTAGHFPPLINLLQCFAPVPLPIGGFLLIPNTVFVGMSGMDIFMGLVRIAIAIVIAMIFNKLGGKTGGKLGALWKRVGGWIPKGGAGYFAALGNALAVNAAEDVAKIPLGIVMEGKIALPFQIAEFDLTTGQGKIFYWEVIEGNEEDWHPPNYSVGGLTSDAQTTTPTTAQSPTQQATNDVPTLNP